MIGTDNFLTLTRSGSEKGSTPGKKFLINVRYIITIEELGKSGSYIHFNGEGGFCSWGVRETLEEIDEMILRSCDFDIEALKNVLLEEVLLSYKGI